MSNHFHLNDRVKIINPNRWQCELVGIVVDIKNAMSDNPTYMVETDPFESVAMISDTVYNDDDIAQEIVDLHGTIRPFAASELELAEVPSY